jgi:hypothetical protein
MVKQVKLLMDQFISDDKFMSMRVVCGTGNEGLPCGLAWVTRAE